MFGETNCVWNDSLNTWPTNRCKLYWDHNKLVVVRCWRLCRPCIVHLEPSPSPVLHSQVRCWWPSCVQQCPGVQVMKFITGWNNLVWYWSCKNVLLCVCIPQWWGKDVWNCCDGMKGMRDAFSFCNSPYQLCPHFKMYSSRGLHLGEHTIPQVRFSVPFHLAWICKPLNLEVRCYIGSD